MIGRDDRRKHTRIGYDMPLSFSVSILDFTNAKPVEASGHCVDKTEDGLGFLTDFPLEPGQVIRVKKVDGSDISALVKWVGKIDGKYRVGILFYK
jgi:hypothetical protein